MQTNQAFAAVIHSTDGGISPDLLRKYNQPGPRYTSYPTAPEWDNDFGPEEWLHEVRRANSAPKPAPVSLYFHIPMCESLCLYCGCNVVITKDHQSSVLYLPHIKREIDWIGAEVSRTRKVEQIHWGGGTPTYLRSWQIEVLYRDMENKFTIADDAEISIEIDPRVTTEEQCRVLRLLGFNRLSMGIQDFDPLVQKTINRIQPYENTRHLFDYCRQIGFQSMNIDLIYGLPHQTVEGFGDTLEKVIAMNPDRIAVFSYAHVPWMKKQQGSFAKHLPDGYEKLRIFNHAIERLTDAGYRYIGLDHFARESDEISRAQDDRTLHRNFQGYTTRRGCDLYGFGLSAISALDNAYAQNQRELPRYYDAIAADRWPTMRGVRLTPDDRLRRSVINRILCHSVVVKSEVEQEFGIDFDAYFAGELKRLAELEEDGLVRLERERIELQGPGRIFSRNVAMIFDAYLQSTEPQQTKIFSTTL